MPGKTFKIQPNRGDSMLSLSSGIWAVLLWLTFFLSRNWINNNKKYSYKGSHNMDLDHGPRYTKVGWCGAYCTTLRPPVPVGTHDKGQSNPPLHVDANCVHNKHETGFNPNPKGSFTCLFRAPTAGIAVWSADSPSPPRIVCRARVLKTKKDISAGT